MTLLAQTDTDGLENNGKQYKSHYLCNKVVVICNTHAAFIAVFHGPALSFTGGFERNKDTNQNGYTLLILFVRFYIMFDIMQGMANGFGSGLQICLSKTSGYTPPPDS